MTDLLHWQRAFRAHQRQQRLEIAIAVVCIVGAVVVAI